MVRNRRSPVALLASLLVLDAILIAGTPTVRAALPAEESSADQAPQTASTAEPLPAAVSPDAQDSKRPLSSPEAASAEEIKRWRGQTWQIAIALDAPSLVPQAVQYALFDEDPGSAFAAQVRIMQGFYLQQSKQADTASRREQLRSVNLSVNWDIGFKKITGDKLYLLTGRPEGGSFPTILSSNSPAGKKWIVTKTVHVDGKPICWCLPVEVKIGEAVNVTLTEDNTFDLEKAYDEAVGQPAVVGDKAAEGDKEVPRDKATHADKAAPGEKATPGEKAADSGKTPDRGKAELAKKSPPGEEEPGEDEPSILSMLKKALGMSEGKAKLAEGDDEGYALYRQMIAAMRQADSLSYISRYGMQGKGNFSHSCTYRAWLKKPNYFRVEGEASSGKNSGILIGDGKKLWIYWPEGRPFVDEDSEADKETRLTSYMTKRAPLAAHSIGHEVCFLGNGMSMPVIDPSTFHGYTDSLQAYLDGVTSLPAEKVGDEECDHILVNIMKHQRSWEIWLSKADHLPRKMKETVRVSYDIIITEDWSDVTVNGDIPDTMFAWKPPEDWTEWRMPSIESGLLKPGTEAPDFELASADGESKIKLSGFRGNVVWFYVWRAG